ncbi:RNI-like protein [Trametes coccinea BRFM310]|uniref:RNI-like protein n=1 Tax=Trametes coccinea (strain BRFM310) TaxID=1353009 RepID=A0A1Y2IRR0_TRAC3|nr:RNI-like protein [Trametes coccinea BRFM310]
MSRTRDIDNEDPLFTFDSYEPLAALSGLEEDARVEVPRSLTSQDSPLSTPLLASTLSPYWHSGSEQFPSTSGMNEQTSSPPKGKGVSRPMSIHHTDPLTAQLDVLSSLDSSSSDELASSSAWAELPPPRDISCSRATHPHDEAVDPAFGENVGPSSGKGKAREQPPSLPPLVFFPTGLEYTGMEWPSNDLSPQTAGPSSYGSGFASIGESEQSASHDVTPLGSPDSPTPVTQIPPRQRSLSNLSVRSTRSLSALSLSKVKGKLSGTKTPGHIVRKLRFKRGDTSPDTHDGGPPSQSPVIDTDILGGAELGRGSCFLPWTRDLKSRSIPPQGTLVDIDVGLSSPLSNVSPIYRIGMPSEAAVLRAKGRSYSSPFPLPSSPLELIPVAPAEISEPIPIEVTNYFEEYLPRELRLKVLAFIVDLYEEDHHRAIANGRWTARRAGRHRWVGVERGIVELLKLSRVSKAWQSLVYDGQLWISLPRLPPSVLARLSKSAGGFVKQLRLAGMTTLTPDVLTDMTEGFCVDVVHPGCLPHTRITTIDLQGCSALSTRSLHHLLIRSPSLEVLCVRGLPAVTNTTCTILATYCTKLVSLDMSRCSNLDGEGIRSLASSTLLRGETLRLKALKLGGLKRVTDEMMQRLGKAAPNLEVLDLSYARGLHNSGIDAFVSLTEEEAKDAESVQLTAREAGRDPTDTSKHWKRITRLRHIALSSCPMLTDHACTHLAYAVPQLEFLELAGIGPDIRDTGLVRLLETTPHIRRLDLEDACEITDTVLAALTPQPQTGTASASRNQPSPPPQTGHALEQLIISYAGNVTNDALLNLIRNCPRLRVLEADNTRMNGLVMKEFVKLSRERKHIDACVCAVDCRGVGEQAVKDVSAHTRPRKGWRAWEARKLAFLDGRDDEGLGVGQDECDETRVVLKTFYSWQTVDAVRAAREKKRKAGRRSANGSAGSAGGDVDGAAYSAAGRTRWWSPNGRRSGTGSPLVLEGPEGRDGCTVM